MELSQKEYTERIETLHDNLQRAWAKDEKVHATVATVYQKIGFVKIQQNIFRSCKICT